MADTSQQEFLAKMTAQIATDIKKKKAFSQAKAHPTPQQLEEKEQEKLRKWANRYPSLGKPPVDFDALERVQKIKETKKGGQILPTQVTMNAQRPLKPEEIIP